MVRKAQGFALIDVIFVCGIIGMLCGIALPRLQLAKMAAGSASAIASMRAVSSAELTFALTCGNGFYAPTLTALGTAPPGSTSAFIGGGLGDANTVQKSGYLIQLDASAYAGAPPSCNGLGAGAAGQGYRAGADPTGPGNGRFFGINSYSLIYEDTVTLFPLMPEVGLPTTGVPLH